MVNYKFAIKKIQKRNGKSVFIPLAKPESKVKIFNLNEWYRIIKIYETYEITNNHNHLETDFGLNYKDCLDHIEKFKKSIEIQSGEDMLSSELILEEHLNDEEAA